MSTNLTSGGATCTNRLWPSVDDWSVENCDMVICSACEKTEFLHYNISYTRYELAFKLLSISDWHSCCNVHKMTAWNLALGLNVVSVIQTNIKLFFDIALMLNILTGVNGMGGGLGAGNTQVICCKFVFFISIYFQIMLKCILLPKVYTVKRA